MEERVRRIRIATYNVHRCVGLDGRRDPGRIGRLIRDMDVDLIGLQEVDSRPERVGDSSQISLIASLTGLHALAGPTILTARGQYGNVLLTRWPARDKALIDLSCRGREPRGAIDALFEVDGMALRVVATHLGLAVSERLHQVRCLEGILREEREDILVMLGDINEWLPGSRPLRIMHRRMGRAPACRTFPSHRPVLALDRIWVRPCEALASLCAVRTPLARIASDHLPVLAEIDVFAAEGRCGRRMYKR
ncbi:MAG: endonuclease/exonuclease/phosphatase family protein [Thermodesulfobacteriota bacterium]